MKFDSTPPVSLQKLTEKCNGSLLHQTTLLLTSPDFFHPPLQKKLLFNEEEPRGEISNSKLKENNINLQLAITKFNKHSEKKTQKNHNHRT